MAPISAISLLLFSLCLLSLSNSSLAQTVSEGSRSPRGSERRFVFQSQCRIERLSAQESRHRIESEAGLTEFFDQRNDQFRCAGVSVTRRTIQPGGLLLPSFSNAPSLVYIVQGRGVMGVSMPGCPESFQSTFRRSEQMNSGTDENEQRMRDHHQPINLIRQGDVVALYAGVTNWAYNDGDTPLVAVTVTDISNAANQLNHNHREFMLAGSQQPRGQQWSRGQQQMGRDETQRERAGSNLLSGFGTNTLADALGISRELAQRLQGRNDERGEIVQVRGRLHMVQPFSSSRSEESEEEERYGGYGRKNGIDQVFCHMKLKENIGDPRRADVFNPNAGRVTTLNSMKLPILRHLQLSAVRGSLRRNAFLAPHWSINAHSIMYVIRGSCRCQVVDNRGESVFDGEVRQGEVLVIPQNFAQLKQARSDDFEWVSIMTSDNEITSPIVGKASAFKGLPEEVLMNSYQISREEARRLKWNRGQEYAVFTPRFPGRAAAAA